MQNHTADRAYAGFPVRLAAYIVDCLLAAIVCGMVKMPFSIAAKSGLDILTKNFLFNYSFLDVLGYMATAMYFALLTYFSHATLGKMLFRLEVVTSREDWTFINVLYRETVGRFLSSIMYVGYLVVLGEKKHQGFHDMLCDTYVVYKGVQSVPKQTIKPSVSPVQPKPQQDFVVLNPNKEDKTERLGSNMDMLHRKPEQTSFIMPEKETENNPVMQADHTSETIVSPQENTEINNIVFEDDTLL